MKRAGALALVASVVLVATVGTARASDRPWLGVAVEDNAPDQGVLVMSVFAHSPAANADIALGDVIIALNGQPTRSSADFVCSIGDLRPYEVIHLTVLRGSTLYRSEARLLAWPVDEPMPDLACHILVGSSKHWIAPS